MSTLTLFIAWLLSLVGLQDCDDPTANLDDCPAATTPVATDQSSGQANYISNGL